MYDQCELFTKNCLDFKLVVTKPVYIKCVAYGFAQIWVSHFHLISDKPGKVSHSDVFLTCTTATLSSKLCKPFTKCHTIIFHPYILMQTARPCLLRFVWILFESMQHLGRFFINFISQSSNRISQEVISKFIEMKIESRKQFFNWPWLSNCLF